MIKTPPQPSLSTPFPLQRFTQVNGGSRSTDRKAADVNTNSRSESTQNIQVNRKNRIIVWGGAYSKSDNYTFQAAANNLQRMYQAKYGNKYNLFVREIKVKKDLIDLINRQPVDSIKSLDVFTHGGENNLYMVSVREGDGSSSMNQHVWWRYVFNRENFGTSDISSLNSARFTLDTKIEIHGCKTAENPNGANNLASNLSKFLSDNGKVKSIVIGHTTNTSPLINGDKTATNEQSYMWLERAVYKQGKLIQLTSQKGSLDEEKLTK